jgi:hypothetical protein
VQQGELRAIVPAKVGIIPRNFAVGRMPYATLFPGSRSHARQLGRPVASSG